ncbi:Xaa-Pro aminopeptidase [Marichromatium bheemlicum]|uniref:Xaa-Pro aminopeptidase n=1 Tax=Marichromatium bheemlicum TaxID=365339 RepID=A0ABX1I528_9GAMM|nr:Xaa-Pro aminopeptidase [Marichromatium bheemlicum]NKN32236.1 Xaa-Pro aminopeptidase [Marichromatium bheemlicum]
MSIDEYRQHRAALIERIGPEAVAIVPAARETERNRGVNHPFRQDSDFRYLTGFPEPDAIAVIVPGRAEGEFVLFCRERDPEREQWHGRRIGAEGAVTAYGADQAHPLSALDQMLPELLVGRTRLHYPIGEDSNLDTRIHDWLGRARASTRGTAPVPETQTRLGATLHELRLHKRPAEIALMRRAAEISAAAHRALMRRCRPGLPELALEAEFQYRCADAGARFQAYPPIVAGGSNACILHYTENDALLRDGELVLIDAGGEFEGYAADITRTFPVNGRFSTPQRELYDLVLESQYAAIAAARPGASVDAPHQAALAVLTRGLVRLGILEGDPETLLQEGAYRPYYMHRTGHWLGLDVHDVGRYRDRDGTWRALEPGMVITVEPGLYLPDEAGIPIAYRGIGIRIEDDVLITGDGHEVLTAAAPKSPEDIEALMAS